jgi:hypothetical protein
MSDAEDISRHGVAKTFPAKGGRNYVPTGKKSPGRPKGIPSRCSERWPDTSKRGYQRSSQQIETEKHLVQGALEAIKAAGYRKHMRDAVLVDISYDPPEEQLARIARIVAARGDGEGKRIDQYNDAIHAFDRLTDEQRHEFIREALEAGWGAAA